MRARPRRDVLCDGAVPLMHTHFKSGKRVLLTYRDGRQEVHKYVQRLRDAVLLEGGIKVRVARLRNISIYKDRTLADAGAHPRR